MSERRQYGIWIALLCALTFFAWALADWIDGETDHWERAAADRHYETFRRVINETSANGGME